MIEKNRIGAVPSGIILIGADTGGTFTDLVMVRDGQVTTFKLPSTPDDPARAVLSGVKHLLDESSSRAPVIVFHGSTVATNALLEQKGAPVFLVTTAGFKELLIIGRQNRPKLYALQPQKNLALLGSDRTLEVAERIYADGQIGIPLSESVQSELVAQLQRHKAESVAICLLHSYANPIHEMQLLGRLFAEGFNVSASHQILPEFREYERASTTVVNAAVAPIMSGYLQRLQQGLGEIPLRIMQSNGGAIKATTAGAEAVRTILSGPAAGMGGAFAAGKGAGFDKILTFDMGGTSTDVGLCDSEIPMTTDTVIAGWPVKVPMIDIHTVGAGGGSIAYLDAGGALRVGPQSAGADPGPVCYGKGSQVTVTDANLYLGRILPERFLGGRMHLDKGRAELAIEELAKRAGLPVQRLAAGILEVAEETMAGALRVVSVEKGYDPRDFILLSFGGAGGLHACALADKLAMERILIPIHPGLLSAVGLVLADTVRDYSLTILRLADLSENELRNMFQPLYAQAKADMATEGVPESQLTFIESLDMRYQGQSFEVNVPLSDAFCCTFHDQHERLYGYQDRTRSMEIVTLRLRSVGRGQRPDLTSSDAEKGAPAFEETATLLTSDGSIRCPVVERRSIAMGQDLVGPALIVEETATHYLAAGWEARIDGRGNLLLHRRGED